jgi:LCP family protein required for cell wall assembly
MSGRKRKRRSSAQVARERRARRWQTAVPAVEMSGWRSWSKRRWSISVAIFAIILLLFVTAVDAIRLYSGIERFDIVSTNKSRQSTNFLFVGSDSRSSVKTIADLEQFGSPDLQAGERADILLLLHVPRDGAPTLLSIPRDLLVEVPGQGDLRLALLLQDGPQELIDALCASLGIGIDHVVVMNFNGLQDLVDAVGGIEVDIPASIRSDATGLNLEWGVQRVDGATALKLVRTRTGEQMIFGNWMQIEDGAKLRMEDSEIVLRAIGSELRSVLAPWSLRSVARAVSDNTRFDSGLGIGELMTLRGKLERLSDDAVTRLPSRMIPGETPIALLVPESESSLSSIGAGVESSCSVSK